MDSLTLRDSDLSSVPARHLSSLTSCVTRRLCFRNVNGCDLVRILTSLKCRCLEIQKQSLGRQETRALVQAMESDVTMVKLGNGMDGEMTLDIGVLTEFSWQNERLRLLALYYKTATRYREEVRDWVRALAGTTSLKITE